jgi:hypothetical protein
VTCFQEAGKEVNVKAGKGVGGRCLLSLLVVFLFIIAWTGQTWGGNGDSPFVADELLIQLRPGVSHAKANKIIKAVGATAAGEIQNIQVKKITVPAHALEQVKEALSHNPNIEFVEHNYLASLSVNPNDVKFPAQWHLQKIDAPFGWDIHTGSSGIPIAIIDSGVDPTHPDLADKLLPGYNFIGDNTDTQDVHGHGTAVAGSAAAMTNNSIGVAGIAWENPIIPLAVLDPSGWATYYDISQAITYAADNSVKVMNISLAGPSSSSTLQNAVNYAWNKGAIIFAAAANENTDTPYYPAACNHVVSVAATTSNDSRASFSNYGEWVDISAPGTSILTTTRGGGYGSWNGTSFASPISAGLGALVLSLNPALTNDQVIEIIENSADDLGAAGFDPYFGFGRINVFESLVAASGSSPEPDITPPSASITAPDDNADVSGDVSVDVSATDNVGVSVVELFINGIFYAEDTTAPYGFYWDTTIYDDGAYQLVALAHDNSGNNGQSNAVTVFVDNAIPEDTVPPSVAILSPQEGASVGKNVTIRVVASDNSGVEQVKFFIDGVLRSIISASMGRWNTRNESTGAHIISVEAFDEAGNVGVDSITVQKSGSIGGKGKKR